MKYKSLVTVLATVTLAISPLVTHAFAADTTVVVTPADLATSPSDVVARPQSWFYYNDETDTIDNTYPKSPPWLLAPTTQV